MSELVDAHLLVCTLHSLFADHVEIHCRPRRRRRGGTRAPSRRSCRRRRASALRWLPSSRCARLAQRVVGLPPSSHVVVPCAWQGSIRVLWSTLVRYDCSTPAGGRVRVWGTLILTYHPERNPGPNAYPHPLPERPGRRLRRPRKRPSPRSWRPRRRMGSSAPRAWRCATRSRR